MKYIFTLLFLGSCWLGNLSLRAQEVEVTVHGRVVEGNNKIPIEFATAVILDRETGETLGGTTTDDRGVFDMIAKTTDFDIEVSFIGFVTQKITDVVVTNGKAELGIITLEEESELLDEVVVRAEKSQTEFKLDKRVFNVGKDLSSTGASALEVLNNVPSVNVDIEGAISLRGSQGVQILINGKPSVIASEQGSALGTITAEMIDKIEVITNPSAKYDAEGTSGIINIVIKKEERKGINGSATINVGTPHNHSFGLSLNKRTEKFNFFTQIGAGYRRFPSDNETINRDPMSGRTVSSIGRSFKNENFYNFVLGTDYHINKYNVITLSGQFAYEIEDENSLTNFDIADGQQQVASAWMRNELTEATNPKYRYELQYKKSFPDDEDHMLLFSALGNLFAKDQSSEFENTNTLGSDSGPQQRTRTDFKNQEHTYKLDYTKPFSDRWTMETGAQYVLNDVGNDFETNEFVDGSWTTLTDLTNIFDWNQKVLGVYSTGAYENDKWGLKLGLRVENTDLRTLLTTTNEANDQNYTNLFPSVHSSYKLSSKVSMQVGYSRRIFRPRMWDLNPFTNIRNNFSVRTGNPDLLPQYSDSYEINSIYILGKLSMNLGVYHRFTTDVVERVSTFEDNVSTSKPINLGTNRTTGVEFNGKYIASKKLSFNGDVNFNYFNREGNWQGTSFDFNASQWSTKMTAKIKLPAELDWEVTGHYQSKVKSLQRINSDNLFVDMGFRKKILEGKGVFSLSIRDLFASRVRESIADLDDFYLYSRQQRGRFITFGFSYGFGKGEAMEFAGEKRRH